MDRHARGAAWRIARFRLARTWSRGLASFVAFVLVIGVTGGVAIASLVGARATQGSYTSLIDRSNPSAMSLSLSAPVSTSRLGALTGVRHVEAVEYSFNAIPISQTNAPQLDKAIASNEVAPMASLDGEYFNQDRVSVVAGRRADPRRAGEFMATALTERLLGWRVGQRILTGIYTNAQVASQQFGKNPVRPTVERYERLVGTLMQVRTLRLDYLKSTRTISRWLTSSKRIPRAEANSRRRFAASAPATIAS